MEKVFEVGIYTPEKVILEGKFSSLVVPAELGYLGVLADHAPLAAALKPGRISLRDPSGKTTQVTVAGEGFLEVLSNRATILLDK